MFPYNNDPQEEMLLIQRVDNNKSIFKIRILSKIVSDKRNGNIGKNQ